MSKHLPDLLALKASWVLSLRAERKSDETLRAYQRSLDSYLAWYEDTDTTPELTKAAATAFVAHLLEEGASANTARLRLAGLKAFADWLVAEGELDDDPLVGITPPKLDQTYTEALTEDQLRALFKACTGTDILARRDMALARLMAETGVRAGEVLNLHISDVDLGKGVAVVRRGKGAKGRVVPFGNATAAAIDRYLRARARQGAPGEGALWLGNLGKPLGYGGLSASLKARATQAKIPNFHLHVLRNTAATRWLAAGGSEQGLMAVAGWSTREMLDRYTGASKMHRAVDEARGLGLGEL